MENLLARCTPFKDRVMIEPDDIEAEVKLASGIIVPKGTTNETKPHTGTIITLGTGYDGSGEFDFVKVGDKVLFGKYGGSHFEEDGRTYLFIRESDIWAILDAAD